MRRFTLEPIACDNQAFGGSTADAAREVARMLRRVAERREGGIEAGLIRDENGNRVSSYELQED